LNLWTRTPSKTIWAVRHDDIKNLARKCIYRQQITDNN